MMPSMPMPGNAPPMPPAGAAGMPPMPMEPPAPPLGGAGVGKLPLPANLQGIVDRGRKATEGLIPKAQPKGLSPAEQARRYAAMSKDTAWAGKLAGESRDEVAKYWLGMIAKHGWSGVREYLNAMQEITGGAG